MYTKEEYTKEELEIVDYIEKDHPQTVAHASQKIELLKSAVTKKYNQRKAINIKVLESDIERFKAKAMSEGMPYQTLINSILHKYITGQLVEKCL